MIVGTGDPALAAGALSLAVRIARADGGVVQPVLVLAQTGSVAPVAGRERLERAAAVAGVDGIVSTMLDRSVLHGAMHAGVAAEASLVLVAEPTDAAQAERDAARAIAADVPPQSPPIALVRGNASRIGVVRTLSDGEEGERTPLASEMARRVAGGPAERLDGDEESWSAQLAPGDVTFVSTPVGDALATFPPPAQGLTVTTLIEAVARGGGLGEA